MTLPRLSTSLDHLLCELAPDPEATDLHSLLADARRSLCRADAEAKRSSSGPYAASHEQRLVDELLASLVESIAVTHCLCALEEALERRPDADPDGGFRERTTEVLAAVLTSQEAIAAAIEHVTGVPRPAAEPGPRDVIAACLGVFERAGHPEAMASADLVHELNKLPGPVRDSHWRYADLTPTRLAQLLAPAEIQTRDITLPDGRRRKAYRRNPLLAAHGGNR